MLHLKNILNYEGHGGHSPFLRSKTGQAVEMSGGRLWDAEGLWLQRRWGRVPGAGEVLAGSGGAVRVSFVSAVGDKLSNSGM